MVTRPIIIATAVIIVFLALFTYYAYSYAVDSPFRISSQRAKYLIRNKEIDLILDVRTDLERQTLGFYPGSVHIQSSELEDKLPNLYPNKNIRILAYCNTGHRARMATEKLHHMGYVNSVYISSHYNTLITPT